MTQTAEGKSGGFNPFKVLLNVRDAGLDAWAKVAISVTTSRPYHELNAAWNRPVTLMQALFRKSSDAAMSQLLAQLNMPSREDVLSLSQRLTRIEMVLDDLGAAMEAMRASSTRPQRPADRASSVNGARSRPAEKEG